MVTVGGLSTTLTLIIRGRDLTEKAFDSAGVNMRRFGVLLATAGAAITSFALISAQRFAKVGDEVQKMSFRTGVAVDQLSRLRFVAEQGGTDLNAMERAVSGMQRTLFNANRGLEISTYSLNRLGISLRDIETQKPIDQFKLLIQQLNRLTNETEKGALAQAVFGRAGRLLLPTISEWEEGFKRLEKEAGNLGLVFNELTADEAAELVDTFNRLRRSLDGVLLVFGSIISPYLREFIDSIVRVLVFVRQLADANPALAKTLIIVATAFGLTLFVMGTFIIIVPIVQSAILALNISLATLAVTVFGIFGLISLTVGLLFLFTNVFNKSKESYVDDSGAIVQSTNESVDSLTFLENQLNNVADAFVRLDGVDTGFEFDAEPAKVGTEFYVAKGRAIFELLTEPLVKIGALILDFFVAEGKILWDWITGDLFSGEKNANDTKMIISFVVGFGLALWDFIIGDVEQQKDVIINFIVATGKSVWEYIQNIEAVKIGIITIGFIVAAGVAIWDFISAKEDAVRIVVIDFIINIGQAIWDFIFGAVREKAEATIDFYVGIGKDIWDFVKLNAPKIGAFIIDFFVAKGMFILDVIKAIIGDSNTEFVIDFVIGAGQTIFDVIKSIIGGVGNFFDSNTGDSTTPSAFQTFSPSANDPRSANGGIESFTNRGNDDTRFQVFLDGQELSNVVSKRLGNSAEDAVLLGRQ